MSAMTLRIEMWQHDNGAGELVYMHDIKSASQIPLVYNSSMPIIGDAPKPGSANREIYYVPQQEP